MYTVWHVYFFRDMAENSRKLTLEELTLEEADSILEAASLSGGIKVKEFDF